jgi:uncharacterized membrane protein YiaA
MPIPSRRIPYLSLFLILLALAWGIFLLTQPTETLLGFTEDDGFYYLKIAQNISRGDGPSLDGVNLTNGFHPLWQIILVPIARLSGDNPQLMLRIVFALQLLLLALSIFCVARFAQKTWGGLSAGIAGVVFLLPRALSFFFSMMEPGLLLFLCSAYLLWGERHAENLFQPQRPVWQDFESGVFLALIFLARLDAGLVGLCYFVILLVRWIASGCNSPARFLAKCALVAAPVLILVFPYLLYNHVYFGHLLTISSAIKHQNIIPWSEKGEFVTDLPEYFLAAVGIALWLIYQLLRKLGHPYPTKAGNSQVSYFPFIILFTLTGLLRYLDGLFFTDLQLNNMGYALLLLPSALLLAMFGEMLQRLGRRFGRKIWGFLASALLLIIILGLSFWGNLRALQNCPLYWYSRSYQAALWADQHLPDNAVIGMSDAGIFAYFCERRVVNLDGLVNDYEYQDILRAGKFGEYLQNQGINYIADVALYDDKLPALGGYSEYEYLVVSRLYRLPSALIFFNDSDEIYRSESFPASKGATGAVFIWRVGKETPVLSIGAEDLALLND